MGGQEREPNPLVPGVRRALRNRPFRILLLAGVVNAIPAAVPAILLPYYVGYVLQPEDPASMVGVYLLVYLGSGLLFVPLWMAFAERVGKLRAFLTAAAVGIFGSVFYFFAGPGDLLFAGCIYFVTGTTSQAGTFLIPAMAADVIDYDELRPGKRREAQYTAFWALIPKFIAIPGSSVPLAVLAAVGYVPNQAQSEDVLFAIRFMYSIFPASFYVCAWLILSRYPISEEVHEKIRLGIAAHDAGRSAPDPLTGRTLAVPGNRRVPEELGWFLDFFSPRELRRFLARGAGSVRTGVLGWCVVWALLGGALVLRAFGGSFEMASEAPLATVFAVVGAGLSITALCFQLPRLGAARRLGAEPPDPSLVEAHLEEA